MKFKEFISRNSRNLILGFITLLAVSFFIPIKLVIFLILSAIINAFFAKFNLYNGMPTEFELSTFSTVLITAVFGLKFGIFNALMSKLVANIYTGSFIVDHIFMISNYCFAALLTDVFAFDIVYLGILITLVNNLIMFFVSKYLLNISLPSNLSYIFTNIFSNICLFLSFAQPAQFFLKSKLF